MSARLVILVLTVLTQTRLVLSKGGLPTITSGDIFGTLDWTLTLQRPDGNAPASYWHDLPYKCTDEHIYTHAEPELIHTFVLEPDEDDEDGAPRYYLLEPIPFNYGFNPQTWESIFEADPRTNVIGDNDPIDMIEMSGNACKRGQVKRVKVLGGLSLVDGGETDWKIVTIDLDSPLAKHYHDITDLPSHTIDTIFNWFSNSKSFDCRIRKGAEFTDPGYQNFLARSGTGESCKGIHDHRDCEPVEYDGYFIVINNAVGPLKYFTNRKQAQETIEGTHAYWEELVKGEVENDGYWLPPGSNADLDEWTNAYTCGTLPKYVFRPAGDYSKRAGQPQRARYQSANYYPEPKKDTYDHEPNLKHHQPRPEYSREYTQPEAQKKY